jgi:Flp pilus assembly protein TadG
MTVAERRAILMSGRTRRVAARSAWRREAGQATVELVAAVPALLLAALISLQLLAAGYALTLADGAAEAGALALAEGGSAAEAARQALPGWADDDISVSIADGAVSVRLRPPSPFGAIAERLAVTSTASARSAE